MYILARATFEDIENIVWDGKETSNLTPLEKVACREMKNLIDKFKASQITRQQATESKIRLKNKYEECTKHLARLEILETLILKTQWDFRYTAEFVEQLVDSIAKTGESFKDSELYSNLAVGVFEFYEKKLKEKYPSGFLPSDKEDKDAPF